MLVIMHDGDVKTMRYKIGQCCFFVALPYFYVTQTSNIDFAYADAKFEFLINNVCLKTIKYVEKFWKYWTY